MFYVTEAWVYDEAVDPVQRGRRLKGVYKAGRSAHRKYLRGGATSGDKAHRILGKYGGRLYMLDGYNSRQHVADLLDLAGRLRRLKAKGHSKEATGVARQARLVAGRHFNKLP